MPKRRSQLQTGEMARSSTMKRNQRIVGGLLRTVDISTAILLLTGQISVTGVFVYPKGLFLSATGPIFNGQRLLGEDYFSNATLNAIDVIVALFLIIGQLRVYGPFPGPHVLSLTVTGPPLGISGVPVPDVPGPKAEEFYRGFREEVLGRFQFQERES